MPVIFNFKLKFDSDSAAEARVSTASGSMTTASGNLNDSGSHGVACSDSADSDSECNQ